MRSLASVQTIVAKYPIENADKIESVRILGWNCVVKKEDNFQVGDKVVYVEVDSIMPDKPEFDFLRDSKGVMKKLRTIRLRGVISQGLVLPLSVLPDGEYAEGQDVTEVLGVTKYEPEVSESLRGKQKTSVKVCFPDWMPHFIRKFMVQYTLPLARFLFNKKMGATFPPFIPKTDETRVQVLQSLLQKHEGVACYVSEKLDGSSCTVYLNEGEFGVCSRNIDLKEEEGNAFWDTVKAHDIEKKLRRLIKEIKINNVAIQGELIGEGIQGNKYKLRGKDIYFFNVWDIDKREYLSLNDFTSFITLINEKTVPILQITHALIASSDYYVELAKGKSVLADVHREGIVIRPKETIKDFESRGLTNGRISFKAINPDFLLKYED